MFCFADVDNILLYQILKNPVLTLHINKTNMVAAWQDLTSKLELSFAFIF